MKNSETEADRQSHGKKHGMVVLNQEITFYHKTFIETLHRFLTGKT